MAIPATAPRLRSLLKWHGGKTYLAARIVQVMPPHDRYLEPYAGGAAVLLRKHPAIREVLGDIDPELMHFYRTLRDHPAGLIARVRSLPYAPETFAWAKGTTVPADGLSRAVAFLVRNRMSRGGLGRDFAWSERLRGKRRPGGPVPGDRNAWETYRDALPAIARRLRSVELVEGDALELIRRHDQPGTLIYCDPPYVPETRTARTVYRFEMTAADHTRLLSTLAGLRHAAVLLSGYRCELYDADLAGWRRVEWDMPNHAGQGRAKPRRTECLWQRP